VFASEAEELDPLEVPVPEEDVWLCAGKANNAAARLHARVVYFILIFLLCFWPAGQAGSVSANVVFAGVLSQWGHMPKKTRRPSDRRDCWENSHYGLFPGNGGVTPPPTGLPGSLPCNTRGKAFVRPVGSRFVPPKRFVIAPKRLESTPN
jgi:hypothetical protein